MFLDIEYKRKMNPAAVQENGAVITYGELTGFCREAIQTLPDRTLVFCLCGNNIGSVAGYAAFMSAGCVPLLLDADIDDGLLQSLIDTYDPDYIWMPAEDVESDEDHWQSETPSGTSAEAIAERDDEIARQTEAAKRNAEKKASVRIGERARVTSSVTGEVRMDRYDYNLVRLRDSLEEVKRLAVVPTQKEMAEGKRARLYPELGLLLLTTYESDGGLDSGVTSEATRQGGQADGVGQPGTGDSLRLVRQSKNNVFVNACAIIDYLEIGEFDRAITTLPMYSSYGLSVINTHLLAGAELLLTESSVDEDEFWIFFKKEKATSLSGVPGVYQKLKEKKFTSMMLPSLKYLTVSGGDVSAELQKEFAEYADSTRKRFYVMYGQAEATAMMSYVPYVRSAEKVGSIGVAIPGGALSLQDDRDGMIEESRVAGELVFEGTNVSLGYATCLDDLAKGDESSGVLHTGVKAEMDEDGYYYLV